MQIFLNGQFVTEERAVVSVFDRGFLYGDGLFETILVLNGNPFRWATHLARLQRGAIFLKIKLPFSPDKLRKFAAELIANNQMPDALLRLTLSRGVGVRGYSPKGANQPTLAMTLHPAPKVAVENPLRWKLVTSSFRLPASDPLAAFKTANKLPYVLARAEADAAGADEALLLNKNGFVVEAATGNLFWIERGTICTPPLDAGILPGVTRAAVLEICRALRIPTQEKLPRVKDLFFAGGVFLSMSSWGIVEAITLDGRKLNRDVCVKTIQQSYKKLLRAETA